MTKEELRVKLREGRYVCDDGLVTTLYVALALGRPLLIEGAAGVGKTEIAKVMAVALGRAAVRGGKCLWRQFKKLFIKREG